MRCAKCGSENRDGRKFCARMRQRRLRARCPKCGAENDPATKFCGECGAALAGPAASELVIRKHNRRTAIRIAPEQSADESLDGERKTVTALFADIKGSTELMEDLDPEEARAIIDPALKLMIERSIATTATSCNRPATASSRCSARRSPTRTIRSARCMRRCGCRRSCKRYSDQAACGWRTADRGARRGQHRRGGGALDRDRRRPGRVHADRAYDQSRLADAGAGADRVDRGQRADAQAVRGILHASRRWDRPESKASASRSTSTR